jgi:hypothetical protein
MQAEQVAMQAEQVGIVAPAAAETAFATAAPVPAPAPRPQTPAEALVEGVIAASVLAVTSEVVVPAAPAPVPAAEVPAPPSPVPAAKEAAAEFSIQSIEQSPMDMFVHVEYPLVLAGADGALSLLLSLASGADEQTVSVQMLSAR